MQEEDYEDFRIVIAPLPDKERHVCEIYYKHYQWVEMSCEVDENFLIQFYSNKNERYWEFPLDRAFDILNTARDKFKKFMYEVDPPDFHID